MREVNYLNSLQDRIQKRINLIKAIDTPKKQAIALEHYRYNIVDFCNHTLWTFDPRVVPSAVPFDLFPKQAEYLLWRQERRKLNQNGLTEKARDAGVTYLNCVHQLHCWLFEDGFAGGFGSRKQDLVDRIGDPSCIFEKLRFMLRMLPKWAIPKRFDWSRHDNFCKLINPDNGATIVGQSGDGCGRGGRTTFFDWDEVAFTPRSIKIDSALSNNTNTIFYTSSANGTANLFYKKRFSYPSECVFTIQWTDDPRKTPAWLEEQKRKYDPVVVASEILIDYGASIEGTFIPAAWVQSAVNLNLAPTGQPVAGLDIATTGKNQSVFTERHGPVIKPQISWSNTNTTVTAHKTRDLMIERKIPHLNFDTDGLGEGVDATLSLIENLEFTFSAVHGASRPSEMVWEGEQRTSAEKFANKRAELWGLLRDRFRKTYDHVNGFAVHPVEELISIPNDPKLIAQISQPLGKRSSTGKILIESKEDMRRRGVDSPDYADSLSLTMEESTADDWLDIGEQRGIYGAIAGY